MKKGKGNTVGTVYSVTSVRCEEKLITAAMILLIGAIKLNGHGNLCLGRAMWHCETPEAYVITNTVRTNTCKESLRLY